MKDRGIKILLSIYLILYVSSGLYGALWISDEFDAKRSYFYAFFAIPVAIVLFTFCWYAPSFNRRFPKTFWSGIILLLIAFSWGNLLLLNAAGIAKDTRLVLALEGKAYDFEYKRGGFGWLYRERW